MKSKPTILTLVKKDLLLEIRQQYTIYGILLYIASTTFVVYLIMGEPEDHVWNALFWIIQLFVCVNAVAKSFLQENRGRMLYFYSIAGPRDFVLSKLLFNMVLMMVMSLLGLAVFTVLLGNPLNNALQFVGIAFLGGISLGMVFTFLAAIAAKAQQQNALMAILGFPIIIPQLMLLMKLSQTAFSAVVQDSLLQIVLLLTGLDLMVAVLAVILFPFLWKD
ncbi:heme exporter protein B [Sediminibacterium ginsengisoli]|uniref:Heme exporter protein B n=2 Tax=Sediminibacterium ginsengisoli TaxID=413434 RepID=A0A1T4QD49_9BACT|nr:heme exporter protein B [Sediminibacterium ginsengisoli]